MEEAVAGVVLQPEAMLTMLIFGAMWVLFEIVWKFIEPYVMRGIEAISGYLPPAMVMNRAAK